MQIAGLPIQVCMLAIGHAGDGYHRQCRTESLTVNDNVGEHQSHENSRPASGHAIMHGRAQIIER